MTGRKHCSFIVQSIFITILKTRTKDLEGLISFLQDKFSVPDLAKNEPTLAYEQLRRRIAAKIGKMNDIIQSEMASCSADDESLRIPLERLTAQARERSR